MRALVAALVLLVPLSACSLASAPGHAPRYADRFLDARLFSVSPGGVSFHVSRPAHVAIFVVDPRLGPSLIYPRFGGDRAPVYAGTHTVWDSGRRAYAGSWGSSFAYPYSGASWASYSSRMMQPRVYYLIASEQPLRTERYAASPYALRAALGYAGMMNSHWILDDLVRLVVPNYAAGRFVTDTYVEWPDRAHPDVEEVPMQVLECRNGRQILAPWYVRSCPGEQPLAPPVGEPHPDSTDASEPQRPDRRRPEPRPEPRIDTGVRATDVGIQRTRPEREGPDAEPRSTEPRRIEPAREPREETRPARPEPRREPTSRRAPETRGESPRTPPARSVEPRSEPSTRPAPRAERPNPPAEPTSRAPSERVDPSDSDR